MTGANLSEQEGRELYDKLKITELLYRYCRAVDRIDRELGYTIWHDDAEADYGTIFRGSGRGVIDHICDSGLRGVVHSHQVTNIIIDLDGDEARSEAYVTSRTVLADGDELKQVATRGRYLDHWSRRAGRWGIEKRFFVGDIMEIRPVELVPASPRFRLDRTDPSYALFDGTL